MILSYQKSDIDYVVAEGNVFGYDMLTLTAQYFGVLTMKV